MLYSCTCSPPALSMCGIWRTQYMYMYYHAMHCLWSAIAVPNHYMNNPTTGKRHYDCVILYAYHVLPQQLVPLSSGHCLVRYILSAFYRPKKKVIGYIYMRDYVHCSWQECSLATVTHKKRTKMALVIYVTCEVEWWLKRAISRYWQTRWWRHSLHE